jgi:hypothetical protein
MMSKTNVVRHASFGALLRISCGIAAMSTMMCTASNAAPATEDINFKSFPDRETPTWIATMLGALGRESAASNYGDWQGTKPIPPSVSRLFRALPIDRQLEFATYRVNEERPSARRWARAMGPLTHPGVEEMLAEMLETDKSYSFRVSLLKVAWFLGNDGNLVCVDRLERALKITARREDRMFFDDTLPGLLRLMHCEDSPDVEGRR